MERSWHNPKKENIKKTSGKCPFCKKQVKKIEIHIKDKHRGQKLIKK